MHTVALPDNQEDRETYLRERGAGDFVDALRERQQSGDVLFQALNPEWTTDTICVVVEYIREEGVAVSLVMQDWDEGPEAALRALRKGETKSSRRSD
jgi:hypothetical protein